MKKFSTPLILGVLSVIAVASMLYVAPYLKEGSSPTQTARKNLNEMSLDEIVACTDFMGKKAWSNSIYLKEN